MVQSYTGVRAATCPWQAFTLPIVADTIAAYAFFESGQLDAFIGNDPPHVIVEAIECYHTAMTRVRDKQTRQREDQRAHDAQHAAGVRSMVRNG